MTATTPNTLANAVADGQTLAAGIRPGIEVVLLDGSADGLAQMAPWAEGHSGYAAIPALPQWGQRLCLQRLIDPGPFYR
jgi:hypothetical protein